MKYEISRADCKFLKSLTIYLNNEDAKRLNSIVDNYIKQREKANKEYSTKIKNKRITDPFYARQKDFVDTRCSTMEKRIRKAINDNDINKAKDLYNKMMSEIKLDKYAEQRNRINSSLHDVLDILKNN